MRFIFHCLTNRLLQPFTKTERARRRDKSASMTYLMEIKTRGKSALLFVFCIVGR